MDMQTALIGVTAFVVSAVVLLLISMFGIKEKSYEEALAEQRQHTNALLGTHSRPKPKEKKTKKAGKKAKEKQFSVAVEGETAEESESNEIQSSESASSHAHGKLHVEFKEPSAADFVARDSTSAKPMKRTKRDKMRPILIHKQPMETPVVTDPVDVAPANHFEQIHPKDDLELLHLHTKDEVGTKHESVKDKSHKNKMATEQDSKEKVKPLNEHEHDKDKAKQKNTVEQEVKEKVKNKQNVNELETTHKEKMGKEKPSAVTTENQKVKKINKQHNQIHLSSDKEEPIIETVTVVPQTNGYIANVGKEKKKKKSEFNTMQQMTGGKEGELNLSLLLDVVRKAELTRSEVQILIDLLLNKQHEAPAVLDEWSEGKADPIQKLKKQLAEKEKSLIEEQEALAGAQAKLREVRAEQIAERSQWQQRARGLEEAFQAKQLELQSVNSRIHTQNQKIQQLQAQLNNLHEEHGTLTNQRQQLEICRKQIQEAEATILQLRNEQQELQGRNNQLTVELHSLNEQNMSAKDHQQNLIVQLSHYKNEVDQKDEYTRQLEESRHDLEQRLGLVHRQENDFKVEISQLKTACQQQAEEVRRLELTTAQATDEIRTVQKQKDEIERSLNQVRAKLQSAETEILELQANRANGVSEEHKSHQEEILNLRNELSSVKSQIQQSEKTYKTDLDESRSTITRLQSELDEQRNKNNESVTKICLEEQELHRKFIQRLFPNVKVPDSLPQDKWLLSVETAIQTHTSSLQQPKEEENNAEIARLQTQNQQYQTIIDDTEGMLKKLQEHIEQEEIHWRNELKTKEIEIDAVKKQHVSELKEKVAELEQKLLVEQEAKQKIVAEYETVRSRSTSVGDPAVIEKLSEEVDRLNTQLLAEQKRLAELMQPKSDVNDVCLKTQTVNSTNGLSSMASGSDSQ